MKIWKNLTRTRYREAFETYCIWKAFHLFMPVPWQMCEYLDIPVKEGGRGEKGEREMLTSSPIIASVCNPRELKWKAAINSKKDLPGSARSEHWFGLDWAPYQCTFVIYLRFSHHSCHGICSTSIHLKPHVQHFPFCQLLFSPLWLLGTQGLEGCSLVNYS